MARAFDGGDVYPDRESLTALPGGDDHWFERFGSSSDLGWNGRWSTEPMTAPAPGDAALIDAAEQWLRQQAMGPYPDALLMKGLAMAMAMAGHNPIHTQIHHGRLDAAFEEPKPDHDHVLKALQGVVGIQGKHRGKEFQGAADRIENVFRHGHEQEREKGRNFRAWVMRHDHTHNLRRDLVSLAVQMFGMADVGVVDDRVVSFLTGVRRPERLADLFREKEGLYRHAEDLLRARAHASIRDGADHALAAAASWCAAGKPSFRKLWSTIGVLGREDHAVLAEGILYSMIRLGGGATALGICNVYGGGVAAANAEIPLPPTGHVAGKDHTK